jgi:hypothetical protein
VRSGGVLREDLERGRFHLSGYWNFFWEIEALSHHAALVLPQIIT